MKVNDSLKNYCSKCLGYTHHTVKAVQSEEPVYEYSATQYFAIVKCQGCDKISYRSEYVDYESIEYDEFGQFIPSSSAETFPPSIRKHRILENIYSLPKDIRRIYVEAVSAFASELYILTTVGFRAVIEAICINEKIGGRDLGQKITRMVTQRLITDKEGKRLHSIRFMGNDSVHEMVAPLPKQLLIVLNLIDNLLTNLYLIDIRVEESLETVIDTLPKFLMVLNQAVSNHDVGTEHTLKELMGKSFRRVDYNSTFENELKAKITDGTFKKLALGRLQKIDKSQKEIQFYIVADNSIEI